MQRNNYLAFAVIFGGLAALLASGAQSQTSVFKNFVGLQASTPGTTQAGHANLSGTLRASQFAGDGAGLTNLNADQLTAGTLDDARLTGNVAMRNQPNTFASPNYFLGNFVGVGRTNQITGSEVFGIGNNNPSFAGMYIRTAPQGLPFYGYSLGGSISAYHYVDGSDGGKWKLYQGTGIAMQIDTNGRIGLGENPHTSARLAVFNQGGAARFSSSGEGFAPTINAVTTGADTLALHGTHASTSGAGGGIRGDSLSPNGVGVVGIVNNSGAGTSFGGYFQASSTQGTGVFGQGTAAGGRFSSPQGTGLFAEGVTVGGRFDATSPTSVGVLGNGVQEGARFNGTSPTGRGIVANGWVGIEAFSQGGGYGVIGRASYTPGQSPSTPSYGVFGDRGNSLFGYAVFSQGALGASGTKAFRIDHPFDPLNKYLLHYSSESPMPQNFYNGNVTTDASGYAWVELPDYFEEINTNFKYQLTVVDDEDLDSFVLAKVSKTIRGNRFQIRTSEPNVTVSWEVKADRNDLWVRKAKPRDVEEKVGHEKGRYQHPDLYGLPPGNAVK